MIPGEGETWVHFRGTEYEIKGIAEHTEDNTILVVYMDPKVGKLWARPLSMFVGDVTTGVPRFKKES